RAGRAQHDEGQLYPDVAADRVATDGQREARRREDESRGAAERPLEQHRPRDGPARAWVAASRLVDPRRVAAERGREHLRGGVGDERRPHEPAEALVHAGRGEKPLPAPRERPDGDDPDRAGGEPPADARVREEVSRPAEIDPPEDVGGGEAGDDERTAGAQRAGAAHAVTTTFTRP